MTDNVGLADVEYTLSMLLVVELIESGLVRLAADVEAEVSTIPSVPVKTGIVPFGPVLA